MWDYRVKIAGWLKYAAEWIDRPRRELESQSKFLDLAPTDAADEAGVYSDALFDAMGNDRVFNIALTGPYGSGKSSIIKSFLKKYSRRPLLISLAAFLPEATPASVKVSKQEVERSILQQMLYGADAGKLPFSRFKRIQTPRKWSSIVISLYVALALFSCWHLFQQRGEIVKGDYFVPLDISNWLNLVCFALGGTLLWLTVYRFYVASFGVSLKSLSLKDIEIAPAAISQESILNRHLDEIIYFFQSTNYELVIIEDLDRFNDPEIFVTLREINKIVNENSGVKRAVRFLYALRDDMFLNTDRTKFFEFIIPVIPIINSSNSIDKVIEQGKRLSLDDRFDRQFLREVSRYLSDLRLIRNIFNEYSIYVANLETDNENVLNANKLLAVIIYKNVFPNDFELLHRGKGNLARILGRHADLTANLEADYKATISRLEEQIDIGERQLPANLEELCKIYAMALIQKLPEQANYINFENGPVPINSLSSVEWINRLVQTPSLTWQSARGHQSRIDVSDFEKSVSASKTFAQRKDEIECKSDESKNVALKSIRELRTKIASLRASKFNEIIRQNSKGVEELFEQFGENSELARFLVFEGFLDDTYYQYTSLFHSGRLSPNDNKFLIQIRGFINPGPDFQIDNPKEVIAAMRDADFGQSYVLNVKIVDCLLDDPSSYQMQTAKLREFIASDFKQCEDFFAAYYVRGTKVSELLFELVKSWSGFIPAAIASAKSAEHVARIITHLAASALAALPKKYPDISEYVSGNLPQIMALEIDFEPERLRALEIEASDLSGLESYVGIARFLFEEGLYRISVDNMDFIFRVILGTEDRELLKKQNYTSVLNARNAALNAKIDGDFNVYLKNVLLVLPENSEETVPAILSIINHDELDIVDITAFLERQSALIPSLDQVPARLHAALFELEKIEPSWENCIGFLASETYSAEILTRYLDSDHTAESLCQSPIPATDSAYPLREFLIESDELDDFKYRSYVKILPKEFKKLPENIGSGKRRIIVEERRVTFSPENLAILSSEDDLQILFVAKNMDRYLENESKYALDDDFRERLLGSDISDEQKLSIIKGMDLTLLASIPSRAAKVGPILVRTKAEVGEFSADAAVMIIVNSQPIDVQIPLLNKFQQRLDDQQVRTILGSLPEPFSDIKPGYVTPRIDNTEANRDFVRWLEARRFISSWSQGGWLRLDNDIRINLFRK